MPLWVDLRRGAASAGPMRRRSSRRSSIEAPYYGIRSDRIVWSVQEEEHLRAGVTRFLGSPTIWCDIMREYQFQPGCDNYSLQRKWQQLNRDRGEWASVRQASFVRPASPSRRRADGPDSLEPAPPPPHSQGVLVFSETPPFGVVSPPEAAAALGTSLSCARGVLAEPQLSELRDALVALPKSLAWGNILSRSQSRSKRKIAWLDEDVRARLAPTLTAVDGPNHIAARYLQEDEASMGALQAVCTNALASQLVAPFGMSEPPLAFQPNFQHDDFPLHYDDPMSDGFGRQIVTLNVKEHAVVLIEESLDGSGRRWHFKLAPGDAWALRGYARERCVHGVQFRRLCEPCFTGCRLCRISLNLRCGEYTRAEARRVVSAWNRLEASWASPLRKQS
uniref:Myb-like domain-containing protein n=1 Tax=Coccolithus braarudii TaxID=221442 RepID=A0A7S0LK21_9EUKA|mmetsp:Transcript_44900/g.95514  ORF Transcript_44900/g.95514 Transcript_44900/m.95514 type:complete len:392 (+) Transcript_44900:2-1177(+)